MASKDLQNATSLYESFREETPKRARKIRIRVPKAVAVMGHAEFIGYVTTHHGEVTLYIHEFAPGSRPLLCANKGRGELFLVAGRFTVTGRGITDLDAQGRVVHAKRRYKVEVLKP